MRSPIAEARELLSRYELDIANPVGDFITDKTIEEEFDKLLRRVK